MDTTARPPWASGPAEILRHGLELLKKDSDSHRRLAMLSIDNAVELMIKTYLGLPRRVTGLKIPRNEYQEFAESFPKLLDAAEKYAGSKLTGINLGEVEWYHRLRNQLYHQGNGLTVERDKVQVYAQLANLLFANLFGFQLVDAGSDEVSDLGEFMLAWVNFQKLLARAASSLKLPSPERQPPIEVVRGLAAVGFLDKREMAEIEVFRRTRNAVVHGEVAVKDALDSTMVSNLQSLTRKLSERVQEKSGSQ
jgi:hypothetical protein